MNKIDKLTRINAAGEPPKIIEEFVGKINSNNDEISIARMKSPRGWSEPGQTPDFNEYTIVLKGTLVVETRNGRHEIKENQSVIIAKSEWVRYSTPFEGGAEYIAVCTPAFTPDRAHREE